MKPLTQAYLDKAKGSLIKAHIGLAAAAVDPIMAEDVGRNAYYTAFHAAQPLVFERTDRNSKTHAGVHRMFHQVTRYEPTIQGSLRSFINAGYELKSTADYDTSGINPITPERARSAVAIAETFLAAVERLL